MRHCTDLGVKCDHVTPFVGAALFDPAFWRPLRVWGPQPNNTGQHAFLLPAAKLFSQPICSQAQRSRPVHHCMKGAVLALARSSCAPVSPQLGREARASGQGKCTHAHPRRELHRPPRGPAPPRSPPRARRKVARPGAGGRCGGGRAAGGGGCRGLAAWRSYRHQYLHFLLSTLCLAARPFGSLLAMCQGMSWQVAGYFSFPGWPRRSRWLSGLMPGMSYIYLSICPGSTCLGLVWLGRCETSLPVSLSHVRTRN